MLNFAYTQLCGHGLQIRAIGGISYDTMGIPQDVIIPWTKNGINSVNYWFEEFKTSITTHFDKINKTPPLDYVVIDYKYFDQISLAVNSNPIAQICNLCPQSISFNILKNKKYSFILYFFILVRRKIKQT